jgi:broad specificity polyphosphatase/5'/3'-nucleotidase SurE
VPEKQLLARARNAPNALSLPFRVELIAIYRKSWATSGEPAACVVFSSDLLSSMGKDGVISGAEPCSDPNVFHRGCGEHARSC